MKRACALVPVVVALGFGCGASSKAPALGSSASGSASSAASASAAKGCPDGAIAVAGGTFPLAATKKSVTVKPHCLDRTEVTVAAYTACVDKGACTPPDANTADGNARWCNWKRNGDFGGHPINCLDHAQAAAYCAFVHGRLPDEGEWEWSARGYDKGSAYPWGDEIPNGRACWDGEDDEDASPDGTCKVGSFPKGANPLGVLDLAGDVWEWTNGLDVAAGQQVDRGGGWLNGVEKLLLAGHRNVVDAKGRWSSVGFRCAYDR